MQKLFNVAVIGATGNVGRETLDILAERKFPVKNIFAIASSSSLGMEVSFGDAVVKIIALETVDFSKIDIAFFSAGSEISKKYAQKASALGCIVIDKSSYFRLDPEIPLIVPEVNLVELAKYKHNKLIANPNCCTIPLVTALKPLDNAAKIERIIISTYQSTSGAGKEAMDELYHQTKSSYAFNESNSTIFPKPIAFNIIPQIGTFLEDGYTSEEQKIALEIEKIMGSHIKASITCVRVPVFVGHSMSVNVEFKQQLNAAEAAEILSESDGVKVALDNQYLTPKEVVGDDLVHISRLRDDHSRKNTINMWICADNLRKGAALNAVQIAEFLT
jgi:aspartate-semialdehyde dehydrogenase